MKTVLEFEGESYGLPPLNGQTWIICGGRDFDNQVMFDGAMRDITTLRGLPDKVVHGAARGADTLADRWARKMGLEVIPVEADWKAHSGAAGPIRNQKMIDDYKPHAVVAFPGGSGTRNMTNKARAGGIEVIEVVDATLATVNNARDTRGQP